MTEGHRRGRSRRGAEDRRGGRGRRGVIGPLRGQIAVERAEGRGWEDFEGSRVKILIMIFASRLLLKFRVFLQKTVIAKSAIFFVKKRLSVLLLFFSQKTKRSNYHYHLYYKFSTGSSRIT